MAQMGPPPLALLPFLPSAPLVPRQAASAYKVEGDRLYWQDRDNQEHHVPLSQIDVPFSQQINRDRNVDFQIP